MAIIFTKNNFCDKGFRERRYLDLRRLCAGVAQWSGARLVGSPTSVRFRVHSPSPSKNVLFKFGSSKQNKNVSLNLQKMYFVSLEVQTVIKLIFVANLASFMYMYAYLCVCACVYMCVCACFICWDNHDPWRTCCRDRLGCSPVAHLLGRQDGVLTHGAPAGGHRMGVYLVCCLLCVCAAYSPTLLLCLLWMGVLTHGAPAGETGWGC